MKIANVIFDWSGVVSDDFEHSYVGIAHVLSKYGQSITREEYKRTYELPWIRIYEKRGINAGTKELNAHFKEKIYSMESLVKPVQGAVEGIRLLKERGFKLAVLSSCPHVKDDMKIYGLDGEFDFVFEDRHDKQAGMRALLEESRFNASETAFIGDTEHDLQVARDNGLVAIGFAGGYRPRSALEVEKPAFIVDDFKGLLKVLE